MFSFFTKTSGKVKKYGLVALFIIFALCFNFEPMGAWFENARAQNRPKEKEASLSEASGPPFLTNQRVLSFSGRRAGEAYFDKEGKRIVFQSERLSDNPFYQIFTKDLITGDTEMVSTGEGQTTCAWFHPGGQKILFSSTHHDPLLKEKMKKEWEERSKKSHQYAWGFDEAYDLYEKDLKTGRLKPILPATGYDAEASYSPDGKWILFASNRHYYSKSDLSVDDKMRLKKDPSYFMDLFIMDAEGKGKIRQLTNETGYDGGPFFSPDGKQITWRKFSADGRTAEIFVMNVDGTDKKPLTSLNAMSWAPFFHPSGAYIIFTTNIHGYGNFELYIVDVKGLKKPVRVSYQDGFDGLPVFSPDGDKLLWTRRGPQGDSQLIYADWNHALALSELGLDDVFLAAPTNLESSISSLDLQNWVTWLSQRAFQGRASGSEAEKVYMQSLAKRFKSWGLKTQLHEFDFLSSAKLQEGQNQMSSGEISYRLGVDWNPLSYSASISLADLEVVFAGYGISAPSTEKFSAYDSYQGLDVAGKWVLVFKDVPQDIEGEFRHHLNYYSRPQHKITQAKAKGAKGVIFVSGPRSSYKQKLPAFKFDGGMSDTSLLVINVSDEAASVWFKQEGLQIEQVQKGLDRGQLVPGFLFKNTKVSARVGVEKIYQKAQNLIAFLDVKNSKNYLLLGAHGDHLGVGKNLSSFMDNQARDQVHYGADDNASGVALVVELAHYFAKNKSKLNENLAFAIWSAEELGNLGSSTWIRENVLNKNPSLKPFAYLNFDMVGRLEQELYLQGAGSSKAFRPWIEKLSIRHPLSMVVQDDPFLPTDALSFYVEAKVPVLSFFTGAHLDYHTPRDRFEKLNYKGLYKISLLAKDLVLLMQKEQKETQLTYEALASDVKRNLGEGRKFKVYLGTIPDYAQKLGTQKGVLLTGVAKGSPAEDSGLMARDILIQIGSTKVENLYDMTYALEVIKPGSETPIKVIRNEAILDLKIVPALKE